MRVAIVLDAGLVPGWSETWVKLCQSNSVEFKTFDSYDHDFIDRLVEYNPDRTLWRSAQRPVYKFKDEIQRQVLDKSNLQIVPNWRTHWLYDHKIRQSYLFKLFDIPHPKTTIFFDEDMALKFVKTAQYPFVVKSDGGAGSKSFRFVERKRYARQLVERAFHREGKWTGREYENNILYAQEYIKTPFVWRIAVFKDKAAFGYKAMNKPGTLTASGQGIREYPDVPSELFNMARGINRQFKWDWCMYDIVWSEKHEKYLVLEITDTCGAHGSAGRKDTYYRQGRRWVPREENISPQEIVFNLFVLEDIQ